MAITNVPLKKKQLVTSDANWFRLPYELWLTVLVEYGVGAVDLVCLEYSAKWFSNGWNGEFVIPARGLQRKLSAHAHYV